MTLRPLPRSLDPLAGESLAGYVLRLAHRLDRAPGRIAVLTGLGRGPIQAGRSMAVPVGRLLHLDAATVAAFAHATRLSAQEVAGLCLDSMRDRYPPLDLDYPAAASPTASRALRAGCSPSRLAIVLSVLPGTAARSSRPTVAPGGSCGTCRRCLPAPSTGGCCCTSAPSASSRSTPSEGRPGCFPASGTRPRILPSASPRSSPRTGQRGRRAVHAWTPRHPALPPPTSPTWRWCGCLACSTSSPACCSPPAMVQP